MRMWAMWVTHRSAWMMRVHMGMHVRRGRRSTAHAHAVFPVRVPTRSTAAKVTASWSAAHLIHGRHRRGR